MNQTLMMDKLMKTAVSDSRIVGLGGLRLCGGRAWQTNGRTLMWLCSSKQTIWRNLTRSGKRGRRNLEICSSLTKGALAIRGVSMMRNRSRLRVDFNFIADSRHGINANMAEVTHIGGSDGQI